MKLNINKTKLILFFMIMPYLKPYNFTLNAVLNKIFIIWKIISTIFILVYFFIKVKKITKPLVLCIIFISIWIISCMLNDMIIYDTYSNILSILGLTLLFEIIVKTKEMRIEIFHFMYNISVVYIILQIITLIKNGPLFGTPLNGYDIFFLGGDNYSAFILLTLCGIVFAHDYKFFDRIRLQTKLFGLLGFIFLVVRFSVSGMVAYFLFLLLTFMFEKGKFKKIIKYFNSRNIIIFTVLFLISVTVFNIHEYFTFALDLIGKSGSFSRAIIWKNSFIVFKDNFLIGNGYITIKQAIDYVLFGANHAHNFILEILMDTGILGTTALCFWIKNYFNINNEKKSKTFKLLMLCFNSFLVCSIFDFYIGLIYFYLLILMIYVEKIDSLEINNCNTSK